MKANTLTNLSFFEAEAKELEALWKQCAIGVPRALDYVLSGLPPASTI